MTQYLLEIAYLIASITFIIGLKMINPPSEPNIFYDSSTEKLKKIYEEYLQSF